MIVSHQHSFIFLKTMKTAGTSVELVLSQICGPDDIVTPIREEHLRVGHGPRNYRLPRNDRSFVSGIRLSLGFERDSDWLFRNHMPAAQVRAVLGEEIWNAYRKVTVVRNPFEQMISRYRWRRTATAAIHRVFVRWSRIYWSAA